MKLNQLRNIPIQFQTLFTSAWKSVFFVGNLFFTKNTIFYGKPIYVVEKPFLLWKDNFWCRFFRSFFLVSYSNSVFCMSVLGALLYAFFIFLYIFCLIFVYFSCIFWVCFHCIFGASLNFSQYLFSWSNIHFNENLIHHMHIWCCTN